MGKGKNLLLRHKTWQDAISIFLTRIRILLCSKIQSVFKLSDGSGLAVTVARYETPAHIDIDKVSLSLIHTNARIRKSKFLTHPVPLQVGVIPDRPLPPSFPKDGDGFCSCFEDPASACNINRVQLFSRWWRFFTLNWHYLTWMVNLAYLDWSNILYIL